MKGFDIYCKQQVEVTDIETFSITKRDPSCHCVLDNSSLRVCIMLLKSPNSLCSVWLAHLT